MKKITFILINLFVLITLSSIDLVFIPTETFAETKAIFADTGTIVHHYRNEFVIASSNHKNLPTNWKRIKKDVDLEQDKMYILYFEETEKADYINRVKNDVEILYEDSYFIIVKNVAGNYEQFISQVHSGIIRIFPHPAKLPKEINFPNQKEKNPLIEGMLNQVEQEELANSVQHLEAYQTRKWDTSHAIQAQNWIDDKFNDTGLPVELIPVPQGTQYAHNVIALQTGFLYPDEYIALGAHFDSISNYGNAPGADDNATGTASILEIARVLSEYQFERSIIYCTFSAEEIGLYGSQAYVQHALANDMEILAYFNIDMAGYLESGFEPHTHIIAPASAQPLVDYYIDITNLYLPDFTATQENFTYGDSDHTSFNNAGIMGIFPFEDVEHYSPYIHSPDDIFGLSVNHVEQHALFTQATMASVANFAVPMQNSIELSVQPFNDRVDLSWNEIDSAAQYLIYRNNQLVNMTLEPALEDSNLENGVFYMYSVEAFAADGETLLASSDSIVAMPSSDLSFPYQNMIDDDFENMIFEESWGISAEQAYTGNFSMADSPEGNYQNGQETSFYLSGIDLSETETAYLQFAVKYELANNDTVFIELSKNPGDWFIIDSFTDEYFYWQEKTYSISSFVGESNQLLRFRLKSDESGTAAGIYLDDILISEELTDVSNDVWQNLLQLSAFPNPFNPSTTIEFSIPNPTQAELSIYNIKGEKVRTLLSQQKLSTGKHQIEWDGKNDYNKNVSSGIYLYQLQTEKFRKTEKMILLK
jgi:hypothetical protein